jgi:hypothetical protein
LEQSLFIGGFTELSLQFGSMYNETSGGNKGGGMVSAPKMSEKKKKNHVIF